jgi:hypothetical protein
MTDKDFKELLIAVKEFNRIIKEQKQEITQDLLLTSNMKPMYIPEDVYDDMCYEMDISEIILLGVA